MSYEDFCHTWTTIDVVRVFDQITKRNSVLTNWNVSMVQGEWKDGCDGGAFEFYNPGGCMNPQYLLNVDTYNTPVYISVLQTDSRYVNGEKADLACIGFTVQQVFGEGACGAPDLYTQTFKSTYCVTLEVANSTPLILQRGLFVIIAYTYDSHEHSPFFLRVIAKKPAKVTLTALPPIYPAVGISDTVNHGEKNAEEDKDEEQEGEENGEEGEEESKEGEENEEDAAQNEY
jgi:hypothetical protein